MNIFGNNFVPSKQTNEIGPLLSKLFFEQPMKALGFFIFGVISTLFEGVGIALFLPLLKYSSAQAPGQQKADVIFRWLFEFLNLTPNTYNILFLIIIAFCVKGFFQLINLKLRTELLTNFSYRMRYDFFEKLEKMTFGYFDQTSKNSLSAIVTTEIDASSVAIQAFLNFIIRGLTAVTLMALAMVTNSQLTLLSIGLGMIAGFILKSLSKRTSKESKNVSAKSVEFNQLAIQFIAGFKYFKATGNFDYVKKKVTGNLHEILKSQNRIGGYSAILGGLQQPIAAIILAALVFVSVKYLGLDVPSILITLALIYKVMSQIIGFQGEWQTFAGNRGHFENLLQSLALMEIHQEKQINGTVPIFTKSIELKGVNFNIGNKKILHDLNMTIPFGKFVGVVGASGSGKSTLIDLLVGIRNPSSGNILIDGVGLNEISLQKWRRKIGFVGQEFALFGDKIQENVTLETDISEDGFSEKVKVALQTSQAWDFILEQEKSGTLGHSHLSVGQRQRIAIARELYRNPELLLLDEATSALDSISESLIQDAFNNKSAQQTILFITHRLSNLKDCDLIYVLEYGSVIEAGSFRELMDKENGAFKNLLDKQDCGISLGNQRVPVLAEDPIFFEIFDEEQNLIRFPLSNISESGLGASLPEGCAFIKSGETISGELVFLDDKVRCTLSIVHLQEELFGAKFLSISQIGKTMIAQYQTRRRSQP